MARRDCNYMYLSVGLLQQPTVWPDRLVTVGTSQRKGHDREVVENS